MNSDKCGRGKSKYDAVVNAARELVEAMETCHICKATLLIDDGPVYCEDGCGANCEDHDLPDCTLLSVLHANLRKALKEL